MLDQLKRVSKLLRYVRPAPPLPPAWVGPVLTLRAVAQCGFPFSSRLVRPFTARSTRYTPMSSRPDLLSTLPASLVSVGCSLTAAVNILFLLTMTLACSWCPHKRVC
jgi:hypothetical protein